ncbi:MAG: DedA family protein [Chloroflexota bacterium]
MEQQILDFVRTAYQAFGWPSVVLLMAIESACIPLPSEIIMPLAGWMLVAERGLGFAYIVLAGIFGAVGNVIGSLAAYGVGAWGGRPFLNRFGKYLLISHHDMDLADHWFDRYGDRIVFFSRLMPAVRTFISLPAGIARMNMTKFIIYSFLGAVPWSIGLAYGGYLLGQNWEEIGAIIRPFYIPLGIACLVLLGLFLWRHIRRSLG